MSKRNTKNIILLILLVSYVVIYKLFIFQNYMQISTIISASFFVIMLALAIKFLGYRKYRSSYISRNIFKFVCFFLALAFIIMYALGFATGFLENSYSRELLSLLDNILAPIVIIILVEVFRYVVIWANKDKKAFIVLFTLFLIIFEIAINVGKVSFNDLSLLFNIFAGSILPIIIKNCVLSYICYHAGYKIPILYRLVMDIYMFIVPILPDLGDYLNALILFSLPLLIYICSSQMVDERAEKIDYVYVKNKISLIDIPIVAAVILVICLNSGIFPVYMVGIASESMVPVLNKGDAIILTKVREKESLTKGDIIAYKKDDRVIIHRIKEVVEARDEIAFITKGDANNSADANVVKLEQVEGKVKFRIPYVAYPTVWLSKLFDNEEGLK